MRKYGFYFLISLITSGILIVSGCGGDNDQITNPPLPTPTSPLDNWQSRSALQEGIILRGIAYGNGTFVAVGGNGTILTSPEGITWTSRTSGTDSILYGVTYGNGTFVAVGTDGTILQSDPLE